MEAATNFVCCAVLCCAVLCCAVLCCAVLCCAVLCCAVLCCAVPPAGRRRCSWSPTLTSPRSLSSPSHSVQQHPAGIVSPSCRPILLRWSQFLFDCSPACDGHILFDLPCYPSKRDHLTVSDSPGATDCLSCYKTALFRLFVMYCLVYCVCTAPCSLFC
jgi:hypothetical protein